MQLGTFAPVDSVPEQASATRGTCEPAPDQPRKLSAGHLAFLMAHAIPVEFAERNAHSEPDGIAFRQDDGMGNVGVLRRPDVPVLIANGNGETKTLKYVGEEGRPSILHRPELRPDADTVWLIEGTKQGLAGAAYAPETVEVWVMQGCYGWTSKRNDPDGGDSTPHQVLDLVGAKHVVITLDADAASNVRVYDAGIKLRKACLERGAIDVTFATAPGADKDGLDDVVARLPERGRAAFVRSLLARTQEHPAKVRPLDDADGQEQIDVTNPARAADWLLDTVGTGALSGVFLRGTDVVRTPRIGEEGYKPLTKREGVHAQDSDGATQVRPMTAQQLASYVRHRYACFRVLKARSKEEGPRADNALFPLAASADLLGAPDDAPNLRTLEGVVSVPTLRADGSIISEPGYDDATGLLYLPEPGLTVPEVSESPTREQVRAAVRLILDDVIGGFPFVNDDHRANFVGSLLTPMLRTIVPPPYKLLAIEAHQPGSGKTLLAQVHGAIHGIVFRGEMANDEAEVGKQITTILMFTTAPVVVFDNVSGLLKSSKLASVLTSNTWSDRVLGAHQNVQVPNDRMWAITGNNLALGGDLPRRTLRSAIDPGMPSPETRTNFRHPNLLEWIGGHRGEVIAALLTLVRAWHAASRPLGKQTTSDSYANWTQVIRGILAEVGIPGMFDGDSTKTEKVTGDDEWETFLRAAYRARGDRPWTAKELLDDIGRPQGISEEAIPGELIAKRGGAVGWGGLVRSLGNWLKNREGRWYGQMTVVKAGKDRMDSALWRVRVFESPAEQ